MRKTEATRENSSRIPAIICLAFFVLLCAVNVGMRLSVPDSVDIAEEGPSAIQEGGNRWYSLKASSYSVQNSFGEIYIPSSMKIGSFTIPGTYHTYFNVLVHTDKENFYMPVRIRNDDIETFEAGTMDLYGMASRLNDDMRKNQLWSSSYESELISDLCLNDNGETATKRTTATFIFASVGAICLCLMGVLLLKSPNKEEE